MTRFISILALLWLVTVSFQGCKSNSDDPIPEPQTSEQEKVIAILTGGTGTWLPAAASNSVTVHNSFFGYPAVHHRNHTSMVAQ